MTRILAVLFAGLTALTLAACGSDPDFNDADVAFVTGMIPHHRQAVEMSQMVGGADASPEVQALAERIAAAQGPEIDTMTGFLEDWDQPVPDEMDMDSMGDMDGMMSDSDMQELMGLSGPQFDERFLTMMIEHHAGAIADAQQEQQDGQNADAMDLAEQIEAAQAEEITEMEGLLEAGS
ncbi:MAG: DUF305 domain-containing protein [Geodermatophilaceae bacterium]|nr:DUF305 domain-containing protein [Geodermatophilaceae bacterium]